MLQFVYPNADAAAFAPEVEALRRMGVPCDKHPLPEATQLVLRSFTTYRPEDYPSDPRYVHDFETSVNYLFISRYYPLIADLSIETLLFEQLDDSTAQQLRDLGWTEAFIKSELHALECVGEGFSFWPQHSFDEMRKHFERFNLQVEGGKYAVRRVVDREIIEQEDRYFVFNGHIFHRSGIIPDVVREAERRLSSLGGKYYAIDATPDFIVEVNPGESSDRYGGNPSELFARWLVEAFGR